MTLFRTSLMAGAVALAALMLTGAGPTVKEAMKSVVESTTNVLFAVGGEVDPSNDPKPPPTTEARWKEAADAAAKLKGAAALLLQPDQVKPGPEWTKTAKELGDLADAAEKAAKAKDGAKLSEAANALGDNCTACHSKYKPQS